MSQPTFQDLSLKRHGNIFIIRAFHFIREELGAGTEGAVITRGQGEKFFCTGLELDETDRNPFANTDGFYPMLYTIMDFPFPTIALINGHVFGGAVPFCLSHDYRVMNSDRGYLSMPPVDLGLHFDGIGSLPRLKLQPQIARRMLLEAHKWTGKEALEDGVVDVIASPDTMLQVALDLAKKWAPKAKMGVYGVLRGELWGDAAKKFQRISYVHSKQTSRPALLKL
ncbi:ClpP/crotonase-like domain-containing protein [Rhexocercosporidium sp. MPI-PUGE-AT-0058]|nr:ClpP/crotonase-like domain-containing protein [Rhexocercosporidium sp. MPI-PUGE-AT-0058]